MVVRRTILSNNTENEEDLGMMMLAYGDGILSHHSKPSSNDIFSNSMRETGEFEVKEKKEDTLINPTTRSNSTFRNLKISCNSIVSSSSNSATTRTTATNSDTPVIKDEVIGGFANAADAEMIIPKNDEAIKENMAYIDKNKLMQMTQMENMVEVQNEKATERSKVEDKLLMKNNIIDVPSCSHYTSCTDTSIFTSTPSSFMSNSTILSSKRIQSPSSQYNAMIVVSKKNQELAGYRWWHLRPLLERIIGPALLLFWAPILALGIVVTVREYQGSVGALIDSFRQEGMYSSLVDGGRLPTVWSTSSWAMVGSMWAAALGLTLVLPGRRVWGPMAGTTCCRGAYRANGLLYWISLNILFVLGSRELGLGFYKLGTLHTHYNEAVAVLCVLGFALCGLLYVKGMWWPTINCKDNCRSENSKKSRSSTRNCGNNKNNGSSHGSNPKCGIGNGVGIGAVSSASCCSGSSGNALFDFFYGTELHPRLLGCDLKQLTNARFGMGWWGIAVVSFAAHQCDELGYVSPALMVSAGLQWLYLTKFFAWEEGYFCSMDMQHDRAGFYICWGCLVWVPALYALPAYAIASASPPPYLPVALAATLFVLGVCMILLNYDADRQRQRLRSWQQQTTRGDMNSSTFPMENHYTGDGFMIWGRRAETICAQYYGPDGRPRYSLLLASGWWGISRHFHYLPELAVALCWTIPASVPGFLSFVSSPSAANYAEKHNQQPLLPYAYVIYLAILLAHRSLRDDRRCASKYGPYWVAYCNKVPYKVIPYIF